MAAELKPKVAPKVLDVGKVSEEEHPDPNPNAGNEDNNQSTKSVSKNTGKSLRDQVEEHFDKKEKDERDSKDKLHPAQEKQLEKLGRKTRDTRTEEEKQVQIGEMRKTLDESREKISELEAALEKNKGVNLDNYQDIINEINEKFDGDPQKFKTYIEKKDEDLVKATETITEREERLKQYDIRNSSEYQKKFTHPLQDILAGVNDLLGDSTISREVLGADGVKSIKEILEKHELTDEVSALELNRERIKLLRLDQEEKEYVNNWDNEIAERTKKSNLERIENDKREKEVLKDTYKIEYKKEKSSFVDSIDDFHGFISEEDINNAVSLAIEETEEVIDTGRASNPKKTYRQAILAELAEKLLKDGVLEKARKYDELDSDGPSNKSDLGNKVVKSENNKGRGPIAEAAARYGMDESSVR